MPRTIVGTESDPTEVQHVRTLEVPSSAGRRSGFVNKPIINPTVLEIAKQIGALNINEFPTARAARLAAELLEEIVRVQRNKELRS